jgi:hypothetical protein
MVNDRVVISSSGYYVPQSGETVTWEDARAAEVRYDGSALGMPYHETYAVDKVAGTKRLTGSGHF